MTKRQISNESQSLKGPNRRLTTGDRRRLFRIKLLRWFAKHGRDLPWRRTRDPYKILVSEVMLQQTQVDRVKDFYGRFVKRYPTAEKLARSRPHKVREAWEGLGYYRRASNLHAATRQVTKDHGGKFPMDVQALMQLPGIGRYTAGAVASFAYGKRAPILDTNVVRVLSRIFGIKGDPKKTATQKLLWQLAEDLLPRDKERIWAFNQAIMDFGATICPARRPQCATCPMQNTCEYYATTLSNHCR